MKWDKMERKGQKRWNETKWDERDEINLLRDEMKKKKELSEKKDEKVIKEK